MELPIKNTAQKFQLPVTKVADEEYGEEPDAQTLRTWNSYVLAGVSHDITLDVTDELTVVHEEVFIFL